LFAKEAITIPETKLVVAEFDVFSMFSIILLRIVVPLEFADEEPAET